VNKDQIEAWHFLPSDKKLGYGDGRLVVAGQTYKYDGDPVLCRKGMHASILAIDALLYAPGPIISRVILSGKIVTGEDKLVATERHVIWIGDATDTLCNFARWCALQVIDLWDAPAIVKRYLETGDKSIQDAAGDAALSAAGEAAQAAARDAALSAAREAALSAARAAALSVARDAAWDAAWATMIDKFNNELTNRLMKLKP